MCGVRDSTVVSCKTDTTKDPGAKDVPQPKASKKTQMCVLVMVLTTELIVNIVSGEIIAPL